MNTIRSTWVGWGTLCVAGGGAYYFAKKSINADRLNRHEETLKRKEQAARAEAAAKRQTGPSPSLSSAKGAVATGAPCEELEHDPAPTRHEPDTETERIREKGKYEAAEQFRPPKGNRFS